MLYSVTLSVNTPGGPVPRPWTSNGATATEMFAAFVRCTLAALLPTLREHVAKTRIGRQPHKAATPDHEKHLWMGELYVNFKK